MRRLASTLCALVALAFAWPAAADYLEVQRAVLVHEHASSDSDDLIRLEPGATVALASEQQQNGYYHVTLADGRDGWVYRTFVRRYAGNLPGVPEGGGTVPAPTPEEGGGGSSTALGSTFRPPCTLPFESLASVHPIDNTCDASGGGTTEPQRAQNRAKNNFCASGNAVRITFETFQDLQDRAEQLGVPHGSSNSLPADRSVLHGILTTSGTSLGEGSVVRLSAFLLDAHYSNVSKGESVNCKEKGQENNDIHIAVARTADEEDLCNSVTAEISPHYRPLTWIPGNLNSLNHHPVRLTGQLFFDGSHSPCHNGTGSPRRFSVWEIHPVYGIDVCRGTSLAACDVNNDAQWVRLEEWLNLADSSPDDD